MHTVLAMAVVWALTLAGCPKDTAVSDPDARLKGEKGWTNNAEGNLPPGLIKTFTIHDDFTFKASINPTHIGAYNTVFKEAKAENKSDAEAKAAAEARLAEMQQNVNDNDEATRWDVRGKLTGDEGNICVMGQLSEKNDRTVPNPNKAGEMIKADELVGLFGGYVKITFPDDNTFKFESASSIPDQAAAVNDYFGGTYTRIQ
jgi:hypothetical protein